MTWWQWGLLIAAAVSLGTWALHGMLGEVAKAVCEVRDEVNRLRITMIELDKPMEERDDEIVPPPRWL